MGAVIDPAKHVGLVYSVAKRYTGRGVELNELAAEGTIGLMSAAKQFNPSHGTRFSTYARWWIEAAITRFLEKNRIVHVPVNVVKKRKKAGTLRRDLSLNVPVHIDEGSTTWLDDLADDKASPLDAAILSERRELVRIELKALPKRTRNMVRLRFEDSATLEEIGRQYDLSRERVRQILEGVFVLLSKRLSFLEA